MTEKNYDHLEPPTELGGEALNVRVTFNGKQEGCGITYGESLTGNPGTNPKDRLGAAKPSISKIPPAALIYMALAMGDGAKKYGPFNWRENKVIASIYLDATLRHIMAWLDGEEVAADSKRPHLAHALASLAILVDALETGNLIDDRPVPGAAPALIDKYTVKA